MNLAHHVLLTFGKASEIKRGEIGENVRKRVFGWLGWLRRGAFVILVFALASDFSSERIKSFDLLAIS